MSLDDDKITFRDKIELKSIVNNCASCLRISFRRSITRDNESSKTYKHVFQRRRKKMVRVKSGMLRDETRVESPATSIITSERQMQHERQRARKRREHCGERKAAHIGRRRKDDRIGVWEYKYKKGERAHKRINQTTRQTKRGRACASG